ncbi:hypothetical protein V8F20_006215 [Naviculisporaceae sp. PSN 640]
MPPLPDSSKVTRRYARQHHETEREVTISLRFDPGVPIRLNKRIPNPNFHRPHTHGSLIISIRSNTDPPKARAHYLHPPPAVKAIRESSPSLLPNVAAVDNPTLSAYIPRSPVDQASLSPSSFFWIALGSLAALFLLVGLFRWLLTRRRRRVVSHTPAQLPTIYYRGPDGEEYYKSSPYLAALSSPPGAGCGGGTGKSRSSSMSRGRSRFGAADHRRKHHRRHHGRYCDRDRNLSTSSRRTIQTRYDDTDVPDVPKIPVPVPTMRVRTRVAPGTRRMAGTTMQQQTTMETMQGELEEATKVEEK